MPLAIGNDCAEVGVRVADLERCRVFARDADRRGSGRFGNCRRRRVADLHRGLAGVKDGEQLAC